MNYPGPGTQIGGSLVLYPVAHQTLTNPFFQLDNGEKFQLSFDSGGGHSLYYNLPKLPAGDTWLNAYLTGYVSSNTTDAAAAITARLNWYTGGPVVHSNSGSAAPNTVSLVAGAPLDPITMFFLFPDLLNYNAQGIAVPIYINGSLNNGAVLLGTTQSFVQGLNDYNTSGIQQLAPIGGGNVADFSIDIQQRDRGGTLSAFYNPTLTLFSAVKYAWKPLTSGGGIALAPSLLSFLFEDEE